MKTLKSKRHRDEKKRRNSGLPVGRWTAFFLYRSFSGLFTLYHTLPVILFGIDPSMHWISIINKAFNDFLEVALFLFIFVHVRKGREDGEQKKYNQSVCGFLGVGYLKLEGHTKRNWKNDNKERQVY